MILRDAMENEFEQMNIMGIKLNTGAVSVNLKKKQNWRHKTLKIKDIESEAWRKQLCFGAWGWLLLPLPPPS